MRPLALVLLAALAHAQPQIPRVWDDAILADLELPLARPEFSPKHVKADFYYKIPVRPIWKQYPVYHPDKAPPGYIEWLRAQEPELIWNPAELKTEADWIRAGETVFDAPIILNDIAARPPSDPPFLHDKAWFDRVNPPLTREGALTGYSYIIRTKGKIEVGALACAMCHTRVMPNGAVIKGAQGNFPFDEAFAEAFRASAGVAALRATNKGLFSSLYYAPWMAGDQAAVFKERFEVEYVAKLLSGHLAGSMSRHRAAPWYTVQIPDLIGVQDRRYLDRSGLVRNRGPADLMRYAALNQDGDILASFGDFVPIAAFLGKSPKPEELTRYGDEQLFALVKYLTALKPPANPYKVDKFTRLGEKVFEREGCGGCHTAPLYTNNKLTPAEGFTVPPDHRDKYDILPVVVGTDPGLTMQTRRGTGYYKVPSLRGLWYRGVLGHSGTITTLEEWLSPTRLDYHKGHEFGLKLNGADRFALIAFLRTL